MTSAYPSVLETIRSISNSRYRKMAAPMLSGNASHPTVTTTLTTRAIPTGGPEVKLTPMQIPVIAEPAISHFSCWRRSRTSAGS